SRSVFYTLSLHDALPICLTRNPLLRPQEPIGMTIWSTRHYHSGGSKSGGDQDITRLPIVVLKRLAETPDLTNGIRGGFVHQVRRDRKSTRLNSSHVSISY